MFRKAWRKLFHRTTSTNHLQKRRVYLDTAAAAPIWPEVVGAMEPYLTVSFGNPSALHYEGQQARRAVDVARELVARYLQVKTPGVTFTSGGTESNNLAIIGYLKSLHAKGRSYDSMEVLSTYIEHPATSKTLAEIATWGVVIKYVPVNQEGLIDIVQLESLLTEQTVLLTTARCNSEIGVLQPTQKIARILKKFTTRMNLDPIVLHIDAAQTPLWESCHMAALGADMISLDAGKFGGPKGIGVLACRQPLVTQGIAYGGGQEAGLRPGTEAVAQIVGFATAFKIAQDGVEKRTQVVAALQQLGLELLREMLPGAVLNGPEGESRIVNNLNFSLPGYDTEYAAIVLDTAGFAVSTKSACSSIDSSASDVVMVITNNVERARSTLRITLHEAITRQDLQRLFTVLQDHTQKMREYTQV